MITIFSTPKNFEGIIDKHQNNALGSWRALSPDIEIIIFGDSKGSKEAAKVIDAKYIPKIKYSPFFTPILSDLFSTADKLAKYSIMTFINADIILPDNFLSVVNLTSDTLNKFLMVGHRWDMNVEDSIDFINKSESKIFWDRVQKDSKKHACTGIDYFVYRKNQWKNIPDFIMGFPGYDNWMIWNARRKRIPILDASNLVRAIHQNHDVPRYKMHDNKTGKFQVVKRNQEINKPLYKTKHLNLLDCTHTILNGEISKINERNLKIRYWYKLTRVYPELSIPIKIIRRLYFRFLLMIK